MWHEAQKCTLRGGKALSDILSCVKCCIGAQKGAPILLYFRTLHLNTAQVEI
jgi:hypothetical protein